MSLALREPAVWGDSFGINVPAIRYSPNYFTLRSTNDLAEVLQHSGRSFIEAVSCSNFYNAVEFLKEGASDFGLCLSSLHTYSPETAHIITTALHDRFGMSVHKSMQILTCLQEALANAVVHGNLCIHCSRDTLEGFEEYYRLINESLSHKKYANMRVFVRAWEREGSLRICITHEGEGRLSHDMIQYCAPDAGKRSGRGLFIIQSLAEWVMTDAACKSLDITFNY